MAESAITNIPAFGEFTLNNIKYKAPSYAESRNDMSNNPDVNFAFGIVYGDGATKTLSTSAAYSFRDPENEIKESTMGVRGVVAYSLLNGRNVFFPFGALGHARRKSREWYLDSSNAMKTKLGYGLLRYGSVDVKLGGDLGQNGEKYKYNDYRPMAYNLPDQHGGAYWLGAVDGNHRIALDFNYGNYMTADLGIDDLYTRINKSEPFTSDALPIKPVRTTFSSQ